MTTYIPFQPSPLGPFKFQPTLDGTSYSATILWGLFGQRWYISLQDLEGNQILYSPLVGSPTGTATSSIVWDELRGVAVITLIASHTVPVGALANLTLYGASPAVYNGIWRMTATSPITLTIPMTTDPGSNATVQGTVVANVNLVAGYRNTLGNPFASTLVYREATGFFEVSP